MVQAMVQISEEANQILNIVKAKHNLKDKSEAINLVVIEFGEDILEPELRPEFIEKMKRIEKGKFVKIGTIGEFNKRYGLK